MVGSSEEELTPYWMGMETQTFCVSVTVQVAPEASVSQTTVGFPWQVVVMVPTTTVGVRVTGALISTHCTPVLLQLLTGLVGVVVRISSLFCK